MSDDLPPESPSPAALARAARMSSLSISRVSTTSETSGTTLAQGKRILFNAFTIFRETYPEISYANCATAWGAADQSKKSGGLDPYTVKGTQGAVYELNRDTQIISGFFRTIAAHPDDFFARLEKSIGKEIADVDRKKLLDAIDTALEAGERAKQPSARIR